MLDGNVVQQCFGDFTEAGAAFYRKSAAAHTSVQREISLTLRQNECVRFILLKMQRMKSRVPL
jgi:hypothetical protein